MRKPLFIILFPFYANFYAFYWIVKGKDKNKKIINDEKDLAYTMNGLVFILNLLTIISILDSITNNSIYELIVSSELFFVALVLLIMYLYFVMIIYGFKDTDVTKFIQQTENLTNRKMKNIVCFGFFYFICSILLFFVAAPTPMYH